MHKQQPAVLGLVQLLGVAFRCLIFCFSLIGKMFTLITYLVSQLYIYSFLARSASYWTVRKLGNSKNPKQHLTTEDWAQW